MIHRRSQRLAVQNSPLLLAFALLGGVLDLAACSPQEAPDAPFDSYLGDPDCDPILPGFTYTRELGGLPPAGVALCRRTSRGFPSIPLRIAGAMATA